MSTAAILAVVWLGLGSGITYQVPFSTNALCEVARKEVVDEAARIRAAMPAGSQVMTSAVCLNLSGVTTR